MNDWRERLHSSQEIIGHALHDYHHYAVVMMISGGTDSLTAYHVARYLNIPIDGLIHVVTGTGIPQTTDFVRTFAAGSGLPYWEHNAGSAFENYVLRKGFFGRGLRAHAYAYHLLKATGFRALLSKNIRQGRKGRPILLLNGARQHESENRMFTMKEPIQREYKESQNWWVNIINDWESSDCKAFLAEYAIPQNPVAKLLCRSGECMCGTMQSQEERREAAQWYPEWGEWINSLEIEVIKRFHWGWGEEMPKSIKQEKAGQLVLPSFQPMCSSCNARLCDSSGVGG